MQTYVKVLASGIVDDTLLETLEDYMKRQRKRLNPQNVVMEAIESHGLESVVKVQT